MTLRSKTNKRSVKKSTPEPGQPISDEIKEVVVKEPIELSYKELQAKAKELGLKASGSAVALRERIEGAK